MRVAIADDSTLFRTGLAVQLRKLGFDVCVEAVDGAQLIMLIESDPPEAVILDIRMPPTHTDEGLATAETVRARHPTLGILVLSNYDDVHYADRLLSRGDTGLGYLLKDRVADVEVLASALRRVAEGGCVVDSELVIGLLRHHRNVHTLDRLTESERRTLRYMAEGRSNAGISEIMKVAESTVERYATRIFMELDLSAGKDDNRRVLAVLRWLQTTGRTLSP